MLLTFIDKCILHILLGWFVFDETFTDHCTRSLKNTQYLTQLVYLQLYNCQEIGQSAKHLLLSKDSPIKPVSNASFTVLTVLSAK